MGLVNVSNEYDVSAAHLWAVSTDLSNLARTTGGLVAYRNVPERCAEEGEHVAFDVSLFGLLPWQPYEVFIETLDPGSFRFRTRERGAGIRRWDHDMRVEARPGGSALIETIHVEADVAAFTPIAERFARHVYRRRHAPRLALLTRLDPVDPASA